MPRVSPQAVPLVALAAGRTRRGSGSRLGGVGRGSRRLCRRREPPPASPALRVSPFPGCAPRRSTRGVRAAAASNPRPSGQPRPARPRALPVTASEPPNEVGVAGGEASGPIEARGAGVRGGSANGSSRKGRVRRARRRERRAGEGGGGRAVPGAGLALPAASSSGSCGGRCWLLICPRRARSLRRPPRSGAPSLRPLGGGRLRRGLP